MILGNVDKQDAKKECAFCELSVLVTLWQIIKGNIMNNKIFITGTDTGIGKTMISMLLMRQLYKQGKSPFYFKPFQTGCKDVWDLESDAKFVYQNVAELMDKDPNESLGICLPNPKAPLFAARDAGVSINFQSVLAGLPQGDPLVLEGAGGLLVPLDDKHTTIDFIKTVKPQVILVARAGLGTINHTLLSLNLLKQNGIYDISVVFVDLLDTNEQMIAENMEAIKMFAGIEVCGAIGQIRNLENPGSEVERVMKKLVENLS